MAAGQQHLPDIAAILAKRHDNGADYWATADKRLSKGSPFTTLDCVYMLWELGLDPSTAVLRGAVELIWSAWREDGRSSGCHRLVIGRRAGAVGSVPLRHRDPVHASDLPLRCL